MLPYIYLVPTWPLWKALSFRVYPQLAQWLLSCRKLPSFLCLAGNSFCPLWHLPVLSCYWTIWDLSLSSSSQPCLFSLSFLGPSLTAVSQSCWPSAKSIFLQEKGQASALPRCYTLLTHSFNRLHHKLSTSN